jgi:hypothetical protein
VVSPIPLCGFAELGQQRFSGLGDEEAVLSFVTDLDQRVTPGGGSHRDGPLRRTVPRRSAAPLAVAALNILREAAGMEPWPDTGNRRVSDLPRPQ